MATIVGSAITTVIISVMLLTVGTGHSFSIDDTYMEQNVVHIATQCSNPTDKMRVVIPPAVPEGRIHNIVFRSGSGEKMFSVDIKPDQENILDPPTYLVDILYYAGKGNLELILELKTRLYYSVYVSTANKKGSYEGWLKVTTANDEDMKPHILLNDRPLSDLPISNDSAYNIQGTNTSIMLVPARGILARVYMELSDGSTNKTITCHFSYACIWHAQLTPDRIYNLTYEIYYQSQCGVVKGSEQIQRTESSHADCPQTGSIIAGCLAGAIVIMIISAPLVWCYCPSSDPCRSQRANDNVRYNVTMQDDNVRHNDVTMQDDNVRHNDETRSNSQSQSDDGYVCVHDQVTRLQEQINLQQSGAMEPGEPSAPPNYTSTPVKAPTADNETTSHSLNSSACDDTSGAFPIDDPSTAHLLQDENVCDK